MTTKREKISCPFCFDEIVKETIIKAGFNTTLLKNLDYTVHSCIDPTTNKAKEEIVKPSQWLRCPGCGEQKKTVLKPEEHTSAEIKIKCFTCNFQWYLEKEQIIFEPES